MEISLHHHGEPAEGENDVPHPLSLSSSGSMGLCPLSESTELSPWQPGRSVSGASMLLRPPEILTGQISLDQSEVSAFSFPILQCTHTHHKM